MTVPHVPPRCAVCGVELKSSWWLCHTCAHEREQREMDEALEEQLRRLTQAIELRKAARAQDWVSP